MDCFFLAVAAAEGNTEVSPHFCIACLLAPGHSPDWEPGA